MKKLIPLLLILLYTACHPVHNLTVDPVPADRSCSDTIHEVMLVTCRLPGFCHSAKGIAIVRGDSCIAHFDNNGKPIKAPRYVWDCETAKKRRQHEAAN